MQQDQSLMDGGGRSQVWPKNMEKHMEHTSSLQKQG